MDVSSHSRITFTSSQERFPVEARMNMIRAMAIAPPTYSGKREWSLPMVDSSASALSARGSDTETPFIYLKLSIVETPCPSAPTMESPRIYSVHYMCLCLVKVRLRSKKRRRSSVARRAKGGFMRFSDFENPSDYHFLVIGKGMYTSRRDRCVRKTRARSAVPRSAFPSPITRKS